jgi:hypothetical protein
LDLKFKQKTGKKLMKPTWDRQGIKGVNMEVVEPDTLPQDGVDSYIKGQFALVSRKRRMSPVEYQNEMLKK